MAARTESALQLVRAAARAAGLGERTDAELLAAVRAGDSAAFEAIVRRHGPMVLRTCQAATRCEADADDAFQTTFVLLHRKAAAVRDSRSLAGWLFRVARRTAGNARRAADRRAKREAASRRPTSTTPADLSWREACDVLHAEIDRLPDAYRLPLVLCYLQGLARDEAARRLGWSLNELRGRLERGRDRLRQRLSRRGITLSAGLLAVISTEIVSPKLVAGTVTAARSASPVTLPLAAGVWKAGLVTGLAAAVVLGLALQKDGAHAQPAKEPPKAVAEALMKSEPDAPRMVEVSGKVVGTNGSGVCSVKVIVRRQDQKDAEGVTGLTDPGGRFQVTVPEIADGTPMVAVTVGNDTFAAGWQSWTGPPPSELRLVEAHKDFPIRGRVVDLEGKPLSGVTVSVRAVHAFPEDRPQAFVDWLAGQRPRPRHNTLRAAPPGVTASTTTKADGKFELTGLGDERVVQLLVTGLGIVHETIDAATVAKLTDPGGRRANKVHAATFDHVAAPARPIRGTITDADTGKPVAGLSVNGYGGATIVTTDKDGRYELPGYRKGPRYTVYARPADGSVYFPTMAEVADTGGLDSLIIDLKAKAGVPVRGRLVDAATKKPVAGTLRYWAVAGNPHVVDVPIGQKPGEFFTVDIRPRPDGSFTVAALPGPGFLAVTAEGWFQPARVDPKGFAPETGVPSDFDSLAVAVGGAAITRLGQERYQAIRLMNIDPAKPLAEQVIELTPAEPIRGRFVDPDGKPLTGVMVRGLHESGDFWSDPLGPEVIAHPPHPDRPRRLAFRHDGRKLVGTAEVKAGGATPVEFKLQPWATLMGRLVGAAGEPIARANVFMAVSETGTRRVDTIGPVLTDAAGRFTFDGIVPGVTYRVVPRGGPLAVRQLPPEVTLKAGEERDIGELRIGGKER